MSHLFPGWSSALNHHPALVHFPIAFWLAALLFALLAGREQQSCLRRTAHWLLYLGTLAGVAAAVSGLRAEHSVPAGPVRELLEAHEELMLTSLALAAALSFFAYFSERNPSPRLHAVLTVGLVLLAVLILFGADRGAAMVYRYGVAVNWWSALPAR